ncbi:MAG: hypothetical protein A2139_07035 [Desulfobacca sp. RBG_16_60_12]|nr:MAG: hypothetical protein A2139_07035 [Desulfobacca sp. RBG_16_60_12]
MALWYQKKIMAYDHGLFVRSVFRTLKSKRILEIGPGRGDFLKWAQDRGALVKGWERAPQAVRFLINRGLAAESVVLEDTQNWPDPEDPWDLIIGFHVLEHLVDPTEVVAALLSRMAANGILIFQLPRADSYQARIFGKHWFGLEVPRHVSIPTYLGIERWRTNLNLDKIGEKHFSLRDNASAMLLSLFSSLEPNRQDNCGLNLLGYFFGVWLFQPLAWVEAKMAKGGTIMLALRLKKY